MSGLHFTDKTIGDFIANHDRKALETYLAQKPYGHVNSCYCSLLVLFIAPRPYHNILTYAAMKNDFLLAELLLKYGACFDEVNGKNPVNSAGCYEMRQYMLKALLDTAVNGKKYFSGQHLFYSPISTGLYDALKEATWMKDNKGRFLISALVEAITNQDEANVQRLANVISTGYDTPNLDSIRRNIKVGCWFLA